MRLLICTDLDRTLMPNGEAPESPDARRRFAALVARRDVVLAYVTGRDRTLVEQAMRQYDLPQPDFVIGDVGTSIYQVNGGRWQMWEAWRDELAQCWKTETGHSLQALLGDIPELEPQEASKQGPFKSSYYAPQDIDVDALIRSMQERLAARSLKSRIVWSLDDNRRIGLIDVLPEPASKLNAIRYLIARIGQPASATLFCGDSGNDLSVLCSDIPAVLVANATDAVRTQAIDACRRTHTERAFYAAQGSLLGMNGNYSAGILEGLVHYHPETRAWLDT